MIQINPDNMVRIELTPKEQMTILQYCQFTDRAISDRIKNTQNGVLHLLTGDHYDLQDSIFIAIEQTNRNDIKNILGQVINKIAPDTSAKSIAEQIGGKDFKSIDHLNDHLQGMMNERNKAPDPEMGGLSPEQVTRLIYTPWDGNAFPLKFNKELNLNDLKHSRYFNNTRLFLNTLLELSNEITATATGNLNRKIVKLMFDKMDIDEYDRSSILKYNKVINEDDVLPLHIVRIICEQIGIIKKKSKKFYVVKKYQPLLSDSQTGELYYLLFYNYFRKFNLGYLDRLAELGCIQDTLGYSLYRLGKVCSNYQKVEELPKKVFLPAVMDEINKNPLLQRMPDWVLTSRIIGPLEEFGLLECQYKKDKWRSEIVKVRKTRLFDKFVGVE